ncbi:glycerol-3-phosphate 1-O-acyltransferase PlsY [Histidinibacterium lentulum]|uniref:Glycerol-3-phosphate acyltransferase n=1 Tax=Histidinibacterium lentulum TaxID=2480588 RepID=A0A3N2R4Y9_9RHOB|nr:glycerol-3-phosphate 1-O-acyltransferase PlsY [Histidinibacterium lentulum]ROU02560.1 glycerol-3-phosphate 1-O-acyltransferase [Histidinibacterium lentulum]
MPDLVSSAPVLLLWLVLGYLAGSVPFGIVFARVFGLGDLRKVGSGNIGATNVLRTGHKPAAALTLVMDSGKGAFVTLAALGLAGADAAQAAALASFVGHCFPVWLGFRGGKGVATFLGILLALAWPVGLAACVSWLAAAGMSRISSVGALGAAALAPVWALVLGRGDLVLLAVVLAALVFWRHGENLIRLRAGTEPRIGSRR